MDPGAEIVVYSVWRDHIVEYDWKKSLVAFFRSSEMQYCCIGRCTLENVGTIYKVMNIALKF